ncbi:hypothetical protein D6779_07955 [Candidatus Parcubacteria bacterium]|nr:MAG: hypothetical protein D6779_07955 [Candidatus Parcubacteria bacterium]
MRTLLLIDAHSLLHRAFHALPPLRAPSGKPTGALFGATTMLARALQDLSPDYTAALFDRPEPTFRKEQYEEYKAHRPQASDDLVTQLVEARELFRQIGVRIFEKAGFEADDLIASFVEKFRGRKDLAIVILTGDLDALQLVEDRKVMVYLPRRGVRDMAVYDAQAVEDRYGIPPSLIPDFKALVGDASDNIKGVPGVGPKTAAALLRKYGSLHQLLSHAAVEKAFQKAPPGAVEAAAAARGLILLRRDVPISIPRLSALARKPLPSLPAYFQELGFREALAQRFFPKGSSSQKKQQGEGLDLPRELRDAVVVQGDMFSPVYRSAKVKAGFFLKETIRRLRREGQDLAPPYYDLGVAFWLLAPGARSYGPEAIFRRFLKGRIWEGSAANIYDALAVSARELAQQGLASVFQDIEMQVLPILAEMELRGIAVDTSTLASLGRSLRRELTKLETAIHRAAGMRFNINSPSQIAEVLFQKLGIRQKGKSIKRTPGGMHSTRAEILEELRSAHPIVPLLLRYRELFKVYSTYVRGLQSFVGEDGRIHTEFVQTGTATGRLSSRHPNLQNIPSTSRWGKEIRTAFVAPPGYSLLSFDYSQIELRILAFLSGDARLQEAFLQGKDIHAVTAAKIFQVDPSRVTPEMRRTAKVLNFGMNYGMGATAFSRESGLSRSAAQEFIDAYFREFPRVRQWQEKVLQEARAKGYVQTTTGRKRPLPGLQSLSPRAVAEAERAALNYPIQGLAADIAKLAMIRTVQKLRMRGVWGEKAFLLLAIHDELLFEVADDIIEEVVPLIVAEMERVFLLGKIPLVVTVAKGKCWGALEKQHFPRGVR